jgi:competence protein ComEC
MPGFISVFLFATVAIILMGISFFVPAAHAYRLRWLFGAGVMILIFSITTLRYNQEKQQTEFNFPNGNALYQGYVTDIPQEKPKSIQCNISLNVPNKKKVIVYFQKTDKSSSLVPGDVVIFRARMQPFKNFGNPDDFDYARLMRNRGFAASGYVPENQWMKTEILNRTPYVISQQIRLKALEFYKSFGLENDEYAFVTALTIGYTEFLPQEMEEAFRASGTSHVLSVSGLHVGIIYLVITSMLFFLKGSKRKKHTQTNHYHSFFVGLRFHHGAFGCRHQGSNHAQHILCGQYVQSKGIFVQYGGYSGIFYSAVAPVRIIRNRFSNEFYGRNGNSVFPA